MKKLVVLGASYLQKPLFVKAKELGIETHCFAWEDGAVCKNQADYFYPVSVTEKEQILQKCKEIGINGIISIASDVAVPTMCYVAENMGLIGNSYKDALIATDKYLMRKSFLENNVASPLFCLSDEINSLENFTYPLIVKPTDRSGSRGVEKVYNANELATAIERAKKESFSKQAIIEEFVVGKEVSVEAISWQGKHYILAITDKVTTGEPFFVELEHHQPSELPNAIQEKLKEETLKALDALNIQYGASHTEIKITNDGQLFLIEVGARMGGDFIGSDLVYLSSGYDFVKGVIDIALGKFEKPHIENKKYSGVYFLSKETENIKTIIENVENYPEILKAELTNYEVRQVESSADRSGYFIYQGDKKFLIK